MLVSDIMEKKVITLHPDMTLREASKILSQKEINGAPVVNDNGKLVGILMVSDIIRVMRDKMESMGLAMAFTPFDMLDLYMVNVPQESTVEIVREVADMKVEDVMRKKVYHVHENDTIDYAMDLLAKKDVSRVPVVDDKGRVVGILTRSDVIKLLSRNSGLK